MNTADLRQQMIEAVTAEHYRRSGLRISASPEEHCAAFVDAALAAIQFATLFETEASVLGRLLEAVEDNDVIPGTILRHDGFEFTIHTHGQVTGWLHTEYEEAKARESQG